MHLLMISITVIPLVLLMPTILVDLRERRIPNAVLLGSLVMSLGLAVSGTGQVNHTWLNGLSLWAGGLAVGLLTFMPMYLLRAMGAGDVKLMAACGACLGPQSAWEAALVALILGGVMALAWRMWLEVPRFVWWSPVLNLWQRANALIAARAVNGRQEAQPSTPLERTAVRLPFSLPIILASLGVLSALG